MSESVPPPPVTPPPATPPARPDRASMPNPSGYPVVFLVDPPERIARWRPFVQWILAFPHFVLQYLLSGAAGVFAVAAWVCGVVTGRVPELCLQFIALYVRYTARLWVYASFLDDRYPPFNVDLEVHDRGEYAGCWLEVEDPPEERRRVTILFRAVLAIPHMVITWFLSLALLLVMLVAALAVLVLGRWPAGLRSWVVGVQRWYLRYTGYAYLLTDEYPPFSFS